MSAPSGRGDHWPARCCRSLHLRSREYYQQKAERNVAVAKIRASARVNELVDSESEKVAADMVKWSLGVAGIKPQADAQLNVNLQIKAGYVIDLSERERPMKVVSQIAPAAPDEQTDG